MKSNPLILSIDPNLVPETTCTENELPMVSYLGVPGRKLGWIKGDRISGLLEPQYFPFVSRLPQMIPMDINIGDSRVWGLESGPNLQPCISCWTRGRLVDGGDDRGGTFCVIWGRNKVEICRKLGGGFKYFQFLP